MARPSNGIRLNALRIDNLRRVRISWALPLERAERIGWLALEGMCRQELPREGRSRKRKDCQIDWELLVTEEDGREFQPFGYDRLMRYQSRLYRAGCRAIKYFPLPEETTRWQKISKLARLANGRVLMLQEANSYPQKYRLFETHELMRNGADCCLARKGFYHNVRNGKSAIFDSERQLGSRFRAGLDMAFRTELVRKLPDKHTPYLDNWILEGCKVMKGISLKVEWNESDNWVTGINCIGLNDGESKEMIEVMRKCEPPFRVANCGIKLPEEIMSRIKLIKKLA